MDALERIRAWQKRGRVLVSSTPGSGGVYGTTAEGRKLA